jgi:uncharacterized membrane-anchored protein
VTSRTVRVVVAVVVQVALLGVAAWVPLSVRLTGEEVLLRVEAADRWQPFDDAYVDLTYPDLPGERFPEGEVGEQEVERLDAELGVAFVPLTRDGAVWVGGDVVRSEPADGPFLRCDDSDWRVRCGIETAYVASGSESDGVRAALRSGDAVAVVCVDDAGRAALIRVDAAP